jgi:hypothetical protein
MVVVVVAMVVVVVVVVVVLDMWRWESIGISASQEPFRAHYGRCHSFVPRKYQTNPKRKAFQRMLKTW